MAQGGDQKRDEGPRAWVEFYEALTREAPHDPEAWLALARSLEMLAWSRRAMELWPRAPWTGLGPEGRTFLQGGYPIHEPQEGQFTNPSPQDSEIHRWLYEHAADAPWEEEGLLLGHALWRREAKAGGVGVQMRATGESQEQVFAPWRVALLKQALRAYENALQMNPPASAFPTIREAFWRFKQLAFYEIPTKEGYGSLLSPEPPIPNGAFDLAPLLKAIAQSGLPKEDIATLRVDAALEKMRPGFTLDIDEEMGQRPWDLRGPYWFTPYLGELPDSNHIGEAADAIHDALSSMAEGTGRLDGFEVEQIHLVDPDETVTQNWDSPVDPQSVDVSSARGRRLFRRICLLLYVLVPMEVANGNLEDARLSCRLLDAWLQAPEFNAQEMEEYISFIEGLRNPAWDVIHKAENDGGGTEAEP